MPSGRITFELTTNREAIHFGYHYIEKQEIDHLSMANSSGLAAVVGQRHTEYSAVSMASSRRRFAGTSSTISARADMAQASPRNDLMVSMNLRTEIGFEI